MLVKSFSRQLFSILQNPQESNALDFEFDFSFWTNSSHSSCAERNDRKRVWIKIIILVNWDRLIRFKGTPPVTMYFHFVGMKRQSKVMLRYGNNLLLWETNLIFLMTAVMLYWCVAQDFAILELTFLMVSPYFTNLLFERSLNRKATASTFTFVSVGKSWQYVWRIRWWRRHLPGTTWNFFFQN